MLKVMTIVGTRPELIKMSRVITEFDQHTDHILVHTGQNHDYELNQIFFDELGIRKPDYFLHSTLNSNSTANTIGNLIESTKEVSKNVVDFSTKDMKRQKAAQKLSADRDKSSEKNKSKRAGFFMGMARTSGLTSSVRGIKNKSLSFK